MIINNIELRPIKGYENLYYISSTGLVWSVYSGKFIKPFLSEHGYYRVCLRKYGKNKNKRINRLVAEAWIEKPEGWTEKWDVCHLDDNRVNNDVSNLAWMPHKANCGARKFREAQRKPKGKRKLVVCVETGEVYKSCAEVASAIGLSRGYINQICRSGLTAKGNHYKYIEKK